MIQLTPQEQYATLFVTVGLLLGSVIKGFGWSNEPAPPATLPLVAPSLIARSGPTTPASVSEIPRSKRRESTKSLAGSVKSEYGGFSHVAAPTGDRTSNGRTHYSVSIKSRSIHVGGSTVEGRGDRESQVSQNKTPCDTVNARPPTVSSSASVEAKPHPACVAVRPFCRG